jgi:bifunctional DNA-binding transcriptional regulator/antitoxin component of YhaV-PrlF toxin-antitoxin module
MTQEDYRAALAAAIREYETLGVERRRIDDRLAQLSQTIGTLNKLLGYEPTVPIGLTDAIRLVMRGGMPLTPIEVRDRLKSIGFDVSKYVNDLAAVHTILKRLNDSGELRFIAREPGKHQYTVNRAAVPIMISRDIIKAMYENAAEREAAQAVEEPALPGKRKRRAGTPPGRTRRTGR